MKTTGYFTTESTFISLRLQLNQFETFQFYSNLLLFSTFPYPNTIGNV